MDGALLQHFRDFLHFRCGALPDGVRCWLHVRAVLRRFQILLCSGTRDHARGRRTGSVSFAARAHSGLPKAATSMGSTGWIHLGVAVPDMVHASIHVPHVSRV